MEVGRLEMRLLCNIAVLDSVSIGRTMQEYLVVDASTDREAQIFGKIFGRCSVAVAAKVFVDDVIIVACTFLEGEVRL